VEGGASHALTDQTAVELQKLKRRPSTWRLACQALVQKSVLVLTRPQVGLDNREAAIAAARSQPLPEGPTAWPAPEEAETEPEQGIDMEAVPSTTSGEGEVLSAEER